jgi:hypothetical protein
MKISHTCKNFVLVEDGSKKEKLGNISYETYVQGFPTKSSIIGKKWKNEDTFYTSTNFYMKKRCQTSYEIFEKSRKSDALARFCLITSKTKRLFPKIFSAPTIKFQRIRGRLARD